MQRENNVRTQNGDGHRQARTHLRWPKPGEGPGTDSSLQSSEGTNPADTLTLDFQAPEPEIIHVCHSSPLACGTWSQQPQETKGHRPLTWLSYLL